MALRLLRGAPGAASKRRAEGGRARVVPRRGSPAPLPFLPQELTSEGTGRALPWAAGAGGPRERQRWRRVRSVARSAFSTGVPGCRGTGAVAASPAPSVVLQVPCSQSLPCLPPCPFDINILACTVNLLLSGKSVTTEVFLPCRCFVVLNSSKMLKRSVRFGE